MNEGGHSQDLLAQGLALHRQGDFEAAVACYRRAIEADPRQAETFNALGGALANLGQPQAAAEALQRALQLAPDFLDPHLHLATLLRIRGYPQDAEPLLRRALELDAKNYWVWMELGAVLTLLNRFGEAAGCFEQALAVTPDDPDALHNLGRVAFETGRESDAIGFYRRALAQRPKLAACHTNLGIALRSLGRLDEAGAAFEEALKLEPHQAAAINGRAGLLEMEGRYAEGLALIENAAGANDDPILQVAAARLERRLKRHDEALRRIHALLANEQDRQVRMQCEFLLGDVHDDLAQYDRAWPHYHAANQLKGVSFSPAAWTQQVDAIIAAFPDPPESPLPVAKRHSDRPVFIIGMPRSGTSLLEQILASHPQVFGAGELTTLGVLVDEIPRRINGAPPYPHCIDKLTARRLTRLGQHYLNMLDALDPAAARVTDKMWRNFEYLGLIERMLPGARVIHCRREPLDTGISCYFQNFAGQTGVPFSYDLEHIGAYYRGYQRLMRHWLRVCRLPIYELDYEALVSAPEETSKALVEFLGLQWDDACLTFYNSQRAANTASLAQVKEPIYTRSVGRYRHYEQHLGPLRKALGQ